MSFVPFEFVLFGLTLAGIALIHKQALLLSLIGLVATITYKLLFTGFSEGPGFTGLALHLRQEWVTLANLMLLLVGFAVLAHHFEQSKLPHALPKLLPQGWMAGLILLAIIFSMSAFLDNIAAAVVGGVLARHVYREKVSIGFMASIVASANAGGAGSVIGDTTTTMMWLRGISPLDLAPAFLGALAAFLTFGSIGAYAQHRYASVHRPATSELSIDWIRVLIVVGILAIILIANVGSNVLFPGLEEVAPLLGLAIWVAILAALFVRKPDWNIAPDAAKGALFLVALVALASFMPVETLPPPSWEVTFALGWLSSMFDNIPLTALALDQGGYDWALLAYAVGFGGSMVWFGSSAGVALTGHFREARSVVAWVRAGWHVPLGYVIGFFFMLALRGWTASVL